MFNRIWCLKITISYLMIRPRDLKRSKSGEVKKSKLVGKTTYSKVKIVLEFAICKGEIEDLNWINNIAFKGKKTTENEVKEEALLLLFSLPFQLYFTSTFKNKLINHQSFMPYVGDQVRNEQSSAQTDIKSLPNYFAIVY
ncbi:hypothetical protein WUBG_07907 [Wuchereria bancrofti]|uniref:Uncharacterized protein n=1 Tax=Wuchereria bancrofti TaxID=6293 RepID=J9F1F4_WUCBA|nr:hypothetical protein WUBG_07907 [Wuchereria bancrofti]